MARRAPKRPMGRNSRCHYLVQLLLAIALLIAVLPLYMNHCNHTQHELLTETLTDILYSQNGYSSSSKPSLRSRSAKQETKSSDTGLDAVDTATKTKNENEEFSTALSTGGTPTPYAYAFLIGGIHEDRPSYKGFLYNVLIACNILRKTGSTQDIWVMLQFSPDSKLETLPDDELRYLQAMNIHIKVLPQPKTAESFAAVVYEKFRILQMTQYRRVMFLDADIAPLANLDYLFFLSDSGVFRPNLIVATRGEPCNAGLFILEPEAAGWDELQQVIANQHEAAKDLPHPKFDRFNGWGHNFMASGDRWEAVNKSGMRWNYHASHSDQGLLYYWVKYYKQNTSIVIGKRTENWVSKTGVADLNSPPVKISVVDNEELLKFTAEEPLAFQDLCDKNGNQWTCDVPYRDYIHFSGKKKPWQQETNALQGLWQTKQNINSSTRGMIAPTKLWFEELKEVDKKLDMQIDVTKWNMRVSPLGYMATYGDHVNIVAEKTVATEKTVETEKTQSDPINSFSKMSFLKNV